MKYCLKWMAALLLSMSLSWAQSINADILGMVTDSTGAVITEAKVSVRNLETNIVTETTTSREGAFRFPQLRLGSYELTIEKQGFAKYVQRPIVLRLNQNADVKVSLNVASASEVVTVNADATIINTTNAEIGTNFDSKRVSELPLAPNRNITNIALSIPGVSQLSSGQTNFVAGGVGFSVNGMRLRSNNFMVDGQDANDPSVTGNQQTINNPDIVAEFRVITNQFLAEYGRSAGSVVSVITKSGTNEFHGSAFWFHNNNKLNTLSNQEVNARLTRVPYRTENQFGGTFGGPVIKNKTFFFVSAQKWTDRQLGFGTTLNGAPTEEGRRLLQEVAGTRPTVRALLDFLPAAQTPLGRSASLAAGGRTVQIPLGSITGSSTIAQDNWQWTARGDHRFSDKHTLGMRYMMNDDVLSGTGQVTPPGLTTVSPSRSQSATIFLNSTLSPSVFNEFRVSYQRLTQASNASSDASQAIPSIEVAELGLVGINAAASRTAIGLAVNLPQFRRNNTYQIQNNTSIIKGKHNIKFGIDFRRVDIVSFFGPTTRGSLAYDTLQLLHDDIATVATINATLPGGGVIWPFKAYDYFAFAQDEYRVTNKLTLTYGLRYETPGPTLNSLLPINDRIVAQAGGNPDYRLMNVPPRDLNNWSPRLGFNYRFSEGPGILRWLTGDGKLVMRGGYSRTYDHNFVNLTLNVATAFPFLNSVNYIALNGNRPFGTAFDTIQRVRVTGAPADPRTSNRTMLSPDNRSAIAEQFAFQFQRELAANWGITVGWIGTKGTGLFQTVDANPVIPNAGGRRVNPFFGTVRDRCNCASSVYHSMQFSLDKRLSNNFSMAAHYTWSSFIDTASELFNPNPLSDVAIPQDSFNRAADRGRSSFDRPHRLTVNGVWEVPFFREQKGFGGRILGGWQLSPFLTLQSGAPFSVLNGADPGNRLSGISGLVGVAIRPMVNSTLDLSGMNVTDMFAMDQQLRLQNRPTPTTPLSGVPGLFRQVTAAEGLGNAGRNILRADGIGNIDIGFIKNTRINERINSQFRADFFNLTNTRNFGTPDGRVNSAGFLNQWNTDGGRRRIQLSLRLVF